LAIDVDDVELLYEDRETEGGDASETRDPTDIHRNMGYRFKILCYFSSDEVHPARIASQFTHLHLHPSTAVSPVCPCNGLWVTVDLAQNPEGVR
jgi:hypothetical protein